MQAMLLSLVITVLKSAFLLVVLLICVAFILLADRKVWAAVQLRRGPNVVCPFGLLQSFADLLKFVFKEPIIPSGASKGVFLLAPFVTCILALSAWAVIPVQAGWAIANINVGILYIFAISSLGVYGVIMAGWASNSKYPFLAALRCAAQILRSASRMKATQIRRTTSRMRLLSAVITRERSMACIGHSAAIFAASRASLEHSAMTREARATALER